MIDALNAGERPPDRVLVGYIEFGNRGASPQLRLSGLQPVQTTAHEYDAATTTNNHAGGGKANTGSSASDNDSTGAESFEVICDPLRHFPHLASTSRHRPFRAKAALDILPAASLLGTAVACPSLSGWF